MNPSEWENYEKALKAKKPNATFLSELPEIAAFRRAFRRKEQRIFDDLLAKAQKHSQISQLIEHALPLEVIVLCMLVELQREIMQLRDIFAPPLP
jgi:hypothetical protein